MKWLIIFIISATSLSFSQSKRLIIIEETDYYELVHSEMPIDTLEYLAKNDQCLTIQKFDSLVNADVLAKGGNTIRYEFFRRPSLMDKCVKAKIIVYATDSSSDIYKHDKLVELANENKYAIKSAFGYKKGSYFVGVGAEYIFGFNDKLPISMFIMPEIFIFNSGKDELDVQFSAPTLFGIVDAFLIKNIVGGNSDNRFGIKIDGGFIFTELLTGIFPSDWFKYGRTTNYVTTIQPYASYTVKTRNYDSEIKLGLVVTRWLNNNGLVICCK